MAAKSAPKKSPDSAQIMGGMFGRAQVDSRNTAVSNLTKPGDLLMVNARSCIYALVRHLAPRRVWLPDYLYSSIVDAVQRAEVIIHTYPVSVSLQVDSLGWMAEVGPDDITVVIDYFGFDTGPRGGRWQHGQTG